MASKLYLFRGPLETSHDGILDFIEVLNSLGAINKDVGSSGVRAEAPDLPGLGDVVLILVGQVATSDLEVLLGGYLTLRAKAELVQKLLRDLRFG